MDKNDLLDLINDDDLGLLHVDKKVSSPTSGDLLLESFLEINNFVDTNGREPKSGGDIHEHKLASRLKHVRENGEHITELRKHDVHKLLSSPSKELETMSDIFEDDDLELLSVDESSIFNIKHVPVNYNQRKEAEFIARRRPCSDFDNFEKLFIQVQDYIKSGKNKLKRFEHGDIKQGTFFVLDGVLLYVEAIKMDLEKDKFGKEDGRLRCIFENGTESGMRFRSLQKSLEIGGRTVINEDNTSVSFEDVSDGDKQMGYIYILKSLSTDVKINSIKNLFKIGFSTTSVEKRIDNAEQDPTYLMAPVSIVASYRCFNMNPQKFERLVHRFFSESCLDIEIIDKDGKGYNPKEWFIAPIDIIEKAIELIINGEVINYFYDKNLNQIIRK